MAGSLELSSLFVEGNDDLHTICHLLARHGIILDKTLGPVLIEQAGDAQCVLDNIPIAVRASTNRSVGFVIDANGSVKNRWKAIRGKLGEAGVEPPKVAPSDGFIGESATYKSTVGVWIMPDNTTSFGKLEHLVETLIPENDPLREHALNSTNAARKLGAAFSKPDHVKAVLHCWLAWQEDPGRPFGTAIKAKFLGHDSPTALRFVEWFRRLFPMLP